MSPRRENSWIKIIDLYDEYTHAPLDRRVFLARLAQLTGSTAAAIALVPLLEANQARAALVSPEDQRLETGRTTYVGAMGDMAFRPRAAKLPAVIVIHENRGLNPISRMSRDASRWRAFLSSRLTSCPRQVERPRTRTPRAT